MNQMINNPYIDVRGVYPSYVNGQLSISLEQYMREQSVPYHLMRDVTIEEVEYHLFKKDLIPVWMLSDSTFALISQRQGN